MFILIINRDYVSKFSIEFKMTVNVDWKMISAPFCERTNLAQHAS
jgi:hypothetical protein